MASRVVAVALKAEIGQYVAGMTKAAASTTALGAASDDMAKKTKGSFDVVGKMGQYAGLAVGAAFVGLITKASEFEQAMSAVDAATHASAATMSELRQAAIDFGATTQYSATEAAQGITELAKAGLSAADITGGALAGALSLAAAGQIEVGEAAEIAATQMTVFGLAGDQTSHVADLLAAGAGKAQGSVQDMALALQYAGLPAAGLGISIEQTTGALAYFASTGLIGEKAGTALRSSLVSLTNPVGKTKELMDQLGLSFFDAQGEFIGLDGTADQLQDQLGELTVQQRNAALAQIFGNEALGAAQALYEGGGEAITQWTANVNDAGFAADTAARLNDNLRGDLERLGGAFDTLMISLGSGAQGPLREVVQMLTGLLDGVGSAITWFSELPGPVQATAGALAALAILNGPLSGVLATVRGFGGGLLSGVTGTTSAFGEALGYARANGDGLGTVLKSVGGYAGGQLKAGLGGIVSLFGGPWGIALAGAAAGVSYITSTMQDADEQTTRWAQSILDGSTAMDDLTEAYLAQYNGDKPDWLQQQSELLGFTSSLEDATAEARSMYEAMDPLAQAQQNVTFDTNRLTDAIDRFGQNSPQAQQAADLLAASNQRLADRQGAVAEATADAAARMGEGAAETIDFTEQISEASKEIDELIASLSILTGSNNSLLVAENAVGEAIASATGALDNQTGSVLNADGSINSMSEAGRAASDVLLDMTNSSNELIATMIQQGYSTAEVAARDAALRASFIQTANQMGITGADAERLADSIYGIPAERQTRIEADTSSAEAAVQAFVARVTGTRVTLTGDFVGGAGVNVRRAQGGPVWGAGTATSDSIPAMLSNGEYVVKASAVSKYGVAALDAVNSGRLDDIAHFADGGLASTYSVPVALTGLEQIRVSLAEMAEVASTAAGPAGGGAIGGGWQSIFNVVKGAIPAARQNSTYRPGDPGYHGRGKAVDFGYGSGPGGAGSAGLASINRFLYDNYGSKLAELIYDGIGDDRPDIKNGRPHTYNAATRAQHANHVHAANYRDGGLIGMPQYKQGTPFVPNDGPAYLHKGEAVIPAFANGGMVRAEDGSMVSSSFYDNLGQGIYRAANGELARASNWRDWQQNSSGKWYDPSSREFSGGGSSSSSTSSAAGSDGPLRIEGKVIVNGLEGMISGQVMGGMQELNRILTGRGVR